MWALSLGTDLITLRLWFWTMGLRLTAIGAPVPSTIGVASSVRSVQESVQCQLNITCAVSFLDED
jgi:hypothetical protein